MAGRRWSEIKRDAGPAGEVHEAQLRAAMRDALALGHLREARDMKQTEVASRMGTDQGSVSRLERREDLYLSTLREYVEALGGRLQLVADFPDGMSVQLDPAREAIPVG